MCCQRGQTLNHFATRGKSFPPVQRVRRAIHTRAHTLFVAFYIRYNFNNPQLGLTFFSPFGSPSLLISFLSSFVREKSLRRKCRAALPLTQTRPPIPLELHYPQKTPTTQQMARNKRIPFVSYSRLGFTPVLASFLSSDPIPI